MIEISSLSKTYDGGFQALKNVNLNIEKGEIFALLGPNGAGKTTLIGIICGLVNATGGSVRIDGYDIVNDYRKARQLIGLVPQELTTNAFESVWDTVSFSRGLFGKPSNNPHLENTLKALTLWEKRNNRMMTLSGGMKRRVMIAKALSHEPRVLFLDEPTAGVDVELRKGMWEEVRRLRESGVTIILTTHYIDEAEQMADRIGVINHGEIIVVDKKEALMKRLGSKQLTLELTQPIEKLPDIPCKGVLELSPNKDHLFYSYDTNLEDPGIAQLLNCLQNEGITFKDLHSKQSSLEEIFVSLVEKPEGEVTS